MIWVDLYSHKGPYKGVYEEQNQGKGHGTLEEIGLMSFEDRERGRQPSDL